MAVLPDELWRRILEIGALENTPNLLNYRDFCSLSISCRTLNRLSSEDSYWSSFLASDFPQYPVPHSSAKSLYKLCFKRDKEKKVLAHKRAVLRMESRIAEHSRRISELESLLGKEVMRLKAAASELSNLRNVKQASVALNVWQPEIVRGRQKQIIEQCTVNVKSRISALDMEVKLCKQQIATFDKAHRDETSRLHAAKELLASLTYHPLRDCNLPSSSSCSRADECNSRKKKMKTK
ncbi:F-box protein SKIP24 [Daucus carota subsp. sativus]|uniref:F-box domain-containing protein n=1 Tax=Daucus carota subsp. sativus TaxID=79200 RepID=A0A164WL87_DAUCS|nr:PREDICTED: F-box protein SKIP24 [Daucus carota subsp. sativus]